MPARVNALAQTRVPLGLLHNIKNEEDPLLLAGWRAGKGVRPRIGRLDAQARPVNNRPRALRPDDR
jgi:hypothetical protein